VAATSWGTSPSPARGSAARHSWERCRRLRHLQSLSWTQVRRVDSVGERSSNHSSHALCQ